MRDDRPGITRRHIRHGWAYFDCHGDRITDRDEIDRLNAIAFPPAYERVWFCPQPNGHLLATGYDARGRKQYRYHPAFRRTRECVKYDSLAGFGRALPDLRKAVQADLAARRLSKERAIACVIRLLDREGIRVGNEHYAHANRSFGATTLRRHHANLYGNSLKLKFKGKSGRQKELEIDDRQLIRFARSMQDLPGQHLFQFVDKEGATHPVDSGDVNDYIHDAMGGDFTAKHFRTWAATLTAFEALLESDRHLSAKDLSVIVAERLGNTPAVARKSYIHPALLTFCDDSEAQETLRQTSGLPRRTKWLSREERALIALLDQVGSSDVLLAA
ncbi:DNA topoisomerase IB [Hephaestia sp. MAHUQ-44]|uniref:DNA topoisomerase IB n=1 Tax=Hephaestia sp. MAHUQ-44 TaxID=2952526 RepID=UPI00207791F3|nr:DNA topoisomerase IB [Hephaestia sp. MAHUQ-44]